MINSTSINEAHYAGLGGVILVAWGFLGAISTCMIQIHLITM
jgi:hypothetical protein